MDGRFSGPVSLLHGLTQKKKKCGGGYSFTLVINRPDWRFTWLKSEIVTTLWLHFFLGWSGLLVLTTEKLPANCVKLNVDLASKESYLDCLSYSSALLLIDVSLCQ